MNVNVDCDIEIWRPIVSYPDYEVSDRGRIRSWKSERTLGLILMPKIDRYGYRRIRLRRGSVVYLRSVHRIVAEAFMSDYEFKLDVVHIDADRSNNALGNLEMAVPTGPRSRAIETF